MQGVPSDEDGPPLTSEQATWQKWKLSSIQYPHVYCYRQNSAEQSYRNEFSSQLRNRFWLPHPWDSKLRRYRSKLATQWQLGHEGNMSVLKTSSTFTAATELSTVAESFPMQACLTSKTRC
eukprot:6177469-Pleurochrysis_carterae.AAC.1